MMLEETIKNLKEIGVEDLHKRTHISVYSLNAIIETKFDQISHIQFNGFINLIERNFNVNLDALRDAHVQYRTTHGQDIDNRELFVKTPMEPKSSLAIYIAIGVAILLALLFIFSSSSDTQTTYAQAETPDLAIKKAQQHLASQDHNTAMTQESDTVVQKFNPQEIQTQEVATAKNVFVLHPKEELWIGVVNLDNDELTDTITKEPFVLDSNANLLISLGHGFVKVELSDNIEDLSDRGRVRFHYQAGVLTRVSASKFKELNKGRSW